MANPVQTALRRSNATLRLLRAAEQLRLKNPKVKDVQIVARSKDPDVKNVELLESLACFLEAMGDVKPQPANIINHCVSPQPKPPPKSKEGETHTIDYGDKEDGEDDQDEIEAGNPEKSEKANK